MTPGDPSLLNQFSGSHTRQETRLPAVEGHRQICVCETGGVCLYEGHMGPQCISRPVVMRYEESAGSRWSCGRGGVTLLTGQGQLSDLLTVLTNSINVSADVTRSHGFTDTITPRG